MSRADAQPPTRASPMSTSMNPTATEANDATNRASMRGTPRERPA